MRAIKQRRIPAPKDLPRILDDNFILGLVQQAKLSCTANIPRFSAAIRDAAQRFVTVMAIPRELVMRDEIRGLYSAADRRRYRETARRISQLTPQTRVFIKKRGDRPTVRLAIPNTQAFNDPASRDEACETIVRLLCVGMERGKPLLHAPQPQPRPPRRKAELDLVMWLEVAYLEATGMMPPRTANPNRPGPFARMVQTYLDRIAPGANAVEMLNELHRRRS
jgi:hypothetical protein